MPLDPQAQDVVRALERLGARPIEELLPEEARSQPTPADAVRAVVEERGGDPTPEAVGRVEDMTTTGVVAGIPLRVYWPGGDERFPVAVYYHGGGWVVGSLDSHDSTPRALANAAGCIVVSVGYRQGPEDPFPAAHEDALAAYAWTLQNAEALGGDADRVAVVGEGAGGNLAAVVCLLAREQGLPLPAHQVLAYPITDHAFDKPSYSEHADAKPLSAAAVRWSFGHYATDAAAAGDLRLSPLRAELAGVPPATVITAEVDPLRDDGLRYAEELDRAGVEVIARHYDGVAHGFLGMGAALDAAGAAVAVAAVRLRQSFGTDGAGSLELVEGMEVVSLDEKPLGEVKTIRAGDFLLDRRGLRRDVYVPFGAATRVWEGRVELKLNAEDFDVMELPSPALFG